MKSMLEGLDFSNVKLEPGDKTKLLTGGRNAAVELIRRHEDNLRTALVASLAVIADVNLFIPDETFDVICQQPEFKALETALEPFKVSIDDTKVAPQMKPLDLDRFTGDNSLENQFIDISTGNLNRKHAMGSVIDIGEKADLYMNDLKAELKALRVWREAVNDALWLVHGSLPKSLIDSWRTSEKELNDE